MKPGNETSEFKLTIVGMALCAVIIAFGLWRQVPTTDIASLCAVIVGLVVGYDYTRAQAKRGGTNETP